MLMAENPTADDCAAAVSSPGAALYLIMHAPGAAHVITLDEGDEVTAGRAPDARLHINCASASRAHARFRRRGPMVEVEDLGSRNGTWSDGHRISSPTLLWPGAAVRIGSARIGLAVCAETLRSARGVMRTQLDDAERQAIAAAMMVEKGNQTRAARRLGISRRNLVYKLTKYALR
jgi:pSer/pThr/pTyr-binding forkhead associated (FHA) protein